MNLILPDSPQSVLALFDADKKALQLFADQIVNSVNEGNENPLKIHVLVKKQELVLDKIKEGIKEAVKTEASKYGEKPFAYGSSECHYTPTATSYDFTKCDDIEWESLTQQIEALTEQRKRREDLLKSLTESLNLMNEETGEVFTIKPPVKKQSMGVKVSIK